MEKYMQLRIFKYPEPLFQNAKPLSWQYKLSLLAIKDCFRNINALLESIPEKVPKNSNRNNFVYN